MIRKEVIIRNIRFDDFESMSYWCDEHIGKVALSRDSVIEDVSPWYCTINSTFVVFHFAREEDAVLFQLRWSQ